MENETNTVKKASQAEVTHHGFDSSDYQTGTNFYLAEYSNGLSGIITEYEGTFSAICYNDDEIFDNVNAAAVWLGKRLN